MVTTFLRELESGYRSSDDGTLMRLLNKQNQMMPRAGFWLQVVRNREMDRLFHVSRYGRDFDEGASYRHMLKEPSRVLSAQDIR